MSQRTYQDTTPLPPGRAPWSARHAPKRSAALAGALLLALGACDLGDPTGPAAPLVEPDSGPALALASASVPVVTVRPGENLELRVGERVQLAVPGSEPAADAAFQKVSIRAYSSSLIEVEIPSSPTFDARGTIDSSVTLGYGDGPRVPVASRSNGTLIKVVGPGAYRPVRYYFYISDLAQNGRTPDLSRLVLLAEHEDAGAVLGAVSARAAETQLAARQGAVPGTVVGTLPGSASGTWSSSAPEVLEVSANGIAVARSPGRARVTHSGGGGGTLTVVGSGRDVEFAGGMVVYPSEEVAFIAGPQLQLGSSLNPWPWYDQTMRGRAPVHAQKILRARQFDNTLSGYTYYYDLGLSLYLLYYRTGDVQYRDLARQLVDRWYDERLAKDGTNVAPRSVALGGVLLRALDGRPEMFDYAVMWARHHDRSWLSRHFERNNTWAGIRDGGFTLLYLAQIAAVHPDPAVRAEFRGMARAAGKWYARIQSPDGAWYYNTDKYRGKVTQPFQMGFLLEGLVATHQLTNDPSIARAILKATDFLWRDGFDPSYPWEAMFYAVDENPRKRKAHPGPKAQERATAGYRHLNSPVVHVFGYAYKISGEAKYREQGDRLFKAAFGFDPSDPHRSTGLAHDNGKNYNQSYRSSGRYLVWRLGR